jgi:alkylation response protein AidB-like acyl-CoA dehydrogenase
MHFALSDEQEALREATRRFLASRAPIGHTRARLGLGPCPDLWRVATEEQGWAALTLPEAEGGFGLGLVEQVVLMEEMGRLVHPSPYFATCVLAAPLLAEYGGPALREQWLPALMAGEATATLGWISGPRAWGVEDIGGQALPEAGGYRLSGTLLAVVDGATATLLLVALRCEGEVALFALEAGATGLSITAHSTVDATRPLATLRLDGVWVDESARLNGGAAALQRALDRAAIALGAEQLGVAEVCLEMAVDYAKVRHQFGRPIGSFQAIKHKCADLLVKVESARSAVWYAAAVWDGAGEPEEGRLVAPMVRSWCADAAFSVSADNIQIHGGIGFTAEHDAHLYFKRAQSSGALLGDAAWHREQLARRLGW